MSDLFSRLQEELRFHKSHGIDLTHPRGVILNDKLYPAKQKGLTISGIGNAAYMDIPYESENVAKIYHEVKKSKQKLNVILANPMSYPFMDGGLSRGGYGSKILHNYGNEQYGELTYPDEGLHSHVVVSQKNNKPDWQHLHKTLKEWNDHPGEAYISQSVYRRDMRTERPMSLEEKIKHRAYVNEPAHNPDKITIVRYPSGGGFSLHTYNINTEELTPLKQDWENRDIWDSSYNE